MGNIFGAIMLRFIGELVSGIIGWVYFVVIISSINSIFTERPYLWILIEAFSVGVVVLIIYFIKKEREDYKKIFCEHDDMRTNCKMCIEAEEFMKRESEEYERKRKIKNDAEALKKSEAFRLNNLRHQRASQSLELTPNEFEDSIAKLFVALGYNVKQTPYVNDGGKDAIAKKDGKKYLIECKRYARDKSIGRPMLQKFHAAMVEEKADKGFFVTTAFFTDTSYEYAKKFNIELINGNKLVELYREAFPESEGSISFFQICLECGDTVFFNLNDDYNEKSCVNGHIVKKEIPKYNFNQFTTYKKKRRYYRR